MCDNTLPLVNIIPLDRIEEAIAIVKQGAKASAAIINTTMDVFNSGFSQLAGTAVLRRQGWLGSTSFHPEVQPRILDIPFNGQTCETCG